MAQLQHHVLVLAAIFLFFNLHNLFELAAAADRSAKGLALVESICLDTKKLGCQNYDVCVSSLKSDHRSSKINQLNDMIRLSVEVALANAQQTRELIRRLAVSQGSLKECSKKFDNVVGSVQSCLDSFDTNIDQGLEGNMVMMDWAGSNATQCLNSMKKLQVLQMETGPGLHKKIKEARMVAQNVEEILGMAAEKCGRRTRQIKEGRESGDSLILA
ncbi:hypothetical protein ACLOJK_020000 [Asimina triloba]